MLMCTVPSVATSTSTGPPPTTTLSSWRRSRIWTRATSRAPRRSSPPTRTPVRRGRCATRRSSLARRAARLIAPRALTTAAACSQAAYYLPCETAGTTLHLSCSHAGHCAAGQVLTVHVSATQHARDTNGTVLLHSDSLAAVMTLLGHRVDASTGFSYLDRGYSSEAAANASLELVWCLEAHCPTSALDFDAAATRDSCRAEVYNLAGFISRKVSAQHSQPWAPITHHPHLLVVLGPYERFVVRFRNASARSRPLAPPHAPSRSSIA
jgi:hypothetical protein